MKNDSKKESEAVNHTVQFISPSDLPEINELPNPFVFSDGSPVKDLNDWEKRKEEIKQSIQYYQYGFLPQENYKVTVEQAGEFHYRVNVQIAEQSASYGIKVRIPEKGEGPFPVYVYGESPQLGFPFLDEELFLSRGYALVKFDPKEIAEDDQDRKGVLKTLHPNTETGVLMAWAWGYHRTTDALQAISQIDHKKVAITGWSRLGKASLLASAFDPRIQVTSLAASGLSGAGNYRYFYEEDGANEKIENIVGYAPQWFSPRFTKFLNQVNRLPFDQHEIMGLIAPRALLLTQGFEDHWTNPKGSGLSYLAAKKIYNFQGADSKIGMAYRDGGHLMTDEDFEAMIMFADHVFFNRETHRSFEEIPYNYPEEKEAIPWRLPHN